MLEFIASPTYDNWFKKHKPTKSLIICSPYMKQSALNRVLELYDIEHNASNIDLKVLIRGNIEEFTYNRSSDVNIFDIFVGLKNFDISKFRRISNLHMKAYLIDEKFLLITSGNLTNSGMFTISMTENFEGGIATDDETIIQDFLTYFNSIWEQSEELENFYDEVIKTYSEYATNTHNSNKKPQKRKKYKMLPEKDDSESDHSIDKKYALNDLPSAKYDTLRDTLDVLSKTDTPLTMLELGKRLRTKLGMDKLTNSTNNQKFGEEKGNLAVYFGLAHRKLNGSFEYSINTMGKHFLSLSEEERVSYIIEQIQTKEGLLDIIEHYHDKDFKLKDYVYGHFNGTKSTLNRKISPVKSILDLFIDKTTT